MKYSIGERVEIISGFDKGRTIEITKHNNDRERYQYSARLLNAFRRPCSKELAFDEEELGDLVYDSGPIDYTGRADVNDIFNQPDIYLN